MNNIGKRIRELRKKNGLTQEKLADCLGVTYKSISKWETGSACPDRHTSAYFQLVLRNSRDLPLR